MISLTDAAVSTAAELSPPATDHLKVAAGVYITLHGHFYQPPRENPYLDTIERQPNAHPFHDWNERIYHECYRPNAFGRILDNRGYLLDIVNNFEYLSFNIGATLMSWLATHHLEVYQQILEADRQSCQRLNGHGNAIAQAYNHMILPLANQRDKHTQIRWGKDDFRFRFRREPEGMWLAETAIDNATIEALIDEGIRFTILAPSQAERCRPLPTEDDPDPEWHAVGGSQIDPNRPYRCFIEDGRYLDIFFYDGPISRDMGFSDVLSDSRHLVGRLGQAIRGDRRHSQIVSAATDGETFGHHKRDTEKCLAYAFVEEFAQRGWTVTNFAHYLSLSPPTWEVVLKPVTAWSCSHGVDRWQDDCGCGGGGTWHLKWRRPLRDALDWLRDELIAIYEREGRRFFQDPWRARDDYIHVILDRAPEKVEQFFQRQQVQPLSPDERIDALRLLEMQRHALLMYTSCGWFFEEISRTEGVQILRYAARALELAEEVSGSQLEAEFVRRLALAPSNVEKFKDGAGVYHQLVVSARVSFPQIAAHYAISSLFANYSSQQQVYCYAASQLDYQKQQLGSQNLAVGQVHLTSQITGESHHFTFAVLHLGGWDFHCCIQPFSGRSAYAKLKEQLFATFNQASVVQTVLAMSEAFGNQSFSLQHLFAEERYRIMQILTAKTKKRLDQLYTQVYRDNYSILVAFQRDELPVPQELQVAAEIALSHRCLLAIAALEQAAGNSQAIDSHLTELEAIAAEAYHLNCRLNVPEAREALETQIWRSLWELLHDGEPAQVEVQCQQIAQAIAIGDRLHLDLCLNRAQELYYNCLESQIGPSCLREENGQASCRWLPSQLCFLLELAEKLRIDLSRWLT
jgi:alpha-amylase/alpha-mannosidase (GH57 family)